MLFICLKKKKTLVLPKTKFIVCLCELSSGIQSKLQHRWQNQWKKYQNSKHTWIAPFGSGKVLVPWMEIENFFLIVHLLVVHHRKCTNFHVIFGRLLLLFYFFFHLLFVRPWCWMRNKSLTSECFITFVCLLWANTVYKNAGVVVCHSIFFHCLSSTSSSFISLGCRTNTHYFLVFLFP